MSPPEHLFPKKAVFIELRLRLQLRRPLLPPCRESSWLLEGHRRQAAALAAELKPESKPAYLRAGGVRARTSKS